METVARASGTGIWLFATLEWAAGPWNRITCSSVFCDAHSLVTNYLLFTSYIQPSSVDESTSKSRYNLYNSELVSSSALVFGIWCTLAVL